MRVSGGSMEPAYPSGRVLLASRLVLWLRAPRRGEVVAFRSPDDSARLELKRVIGLPGEVVSWQPGGAFRINHQPLDEPYARCAPPPPGDDDSGERSVPPRRYFLAGDNRLYSRDSRRYGPVDRRALIAVIIG